jgi:putative transposase
MQRGIRFRCYPTCAQAEILHRWIGCQRYIYNAKVGEDQYYRRFIRKQVDLTGLYAPIDQQYSQFKSKELSPWLYEVPSQILRNGANLWMQSYSRFFKKLGGRPTFHRNMGNQKVWLTSELFVFKPVTNELTGEITHQLYIGTGTDKFKVGVLAFKAHTKFKLPNSIRIGVDGKAWHLSFSYDDDIPEPKDEETLDWLQRFSATELLKMTLGFDRGVNIPLVASDGQQFDFSDLQKKRMAKAQMQKKRWQRRQARRIEGSGGWKKAKRKVNNYARYATNVRQDHAHQTTYKLVSNPKIKLFVFEALKTKNMTKKPKPKQDANGKWIKNGARAKAGLSTGILASNWGQNKTYLQYKARRAGKLVIEVPAHFSSQECSHCGFTHPENRLTQADFLCQSCGHTENADHNASKVIAQRGAKLITSGLYVLKEKKKLSGARKKKLVGTEGPELCEVEISQSTPEETMVRHVSASTVMRGSLILETPATTHAFCV